MNLTNTRQTIKDAREMQIIYRVRFQTLLFAAIHTPVSFTMSSAYFCPRSSQFEGHPHLLAPNGPLFI